MLTPMKLYKMKEILDLKKEIEKKGINIRNSGVYHEVYVNILKRTQNHIDDKIKEVVKNIDFNDEFVKEQKSLLKLMQPDVDFVGILTSRCFLCRIDTSGIIFDSLM
jgi:hypothetical protein